MPSNASRNLLEMLSTAKVVEWANDRVCSIIPGLKAYGIAQAAVKDDSIAPYVDEKYVGIDDVYEAQVYHKQLSVSSTTVAGSGYGDDERSLQSTYQMAMVVFFNESKCYPPDVLYTYIQAAITGLLKVTGYKSVRVNVLSAVLSDQTVWRQEYGNTPYKLFANQRLIQVNYNIVIVFDKSCISIPNCKN